MSTPAADQPDPIRDVQDVLYPLVCAYQLTFMAGLKEPHPAGREALAPVLGLLLEQIFFDLHEPLLALVRGWTRSLLFREQLATLRYHDALESLAMSAFGDIAAALPTCDLQPDKNIVGYLIQIARHGLYDQERSIYEGIERRHLNRSSPPALHETAAMWPRPADIIHGVWDNTGLQEPEDPASAELEDQIIGQYDDQQIRQAAAAFLRTALADRDQQIVAMRLFIEPPSPFETIAQALGNGWTAASVRQRYHRTLARLRRHLADKGLIDSTK